MESPFIRNYWNYYPQRRRYAPSMMEIPGHRRTVPVAPNVVSIPVRFLDSKKTSFYSATKIQKVFRGFLVRKSVKKVLAIETEVNEIEKRLANEENIDVIRKDDKERVKFGEMLMNLLFRLDSVKAVDSGIRNLRKAVIKKAIALQEKIDSIAAADEATDVIYETFEVDTVECDSEAVDRTLELNGIIPEHEDESSAAADVANGEPADDCDDEKTDIESANPSNEHENVDEVALKPSSIEKEEAILEESTACSMESNAGSSIEKEEAILGESTACSMESNAGSEVPQVSEQWKNTPGNDEVPVEIDMHVDSEMTADYAAISEAESQTDSSNNPPNSDDGVAEFGAVDEREGSGNPEDAVGEEDNKIKGREEDGQSRELLGRMMMDNKKMMEMMAQLFEKNETQSQLLCSLSHRVERLEKALVYGMLQKKKKRNSTDCSEKCPKTKKSGK